jgi:hypothetical protein
MGRFKFSIVFILSIIANVVLCQSTDFDLAAKLNDHIKSIVKVLQKFSQHDHDFKFSSKQVVASRFALDYFLSDELALLFDNNVLDVEMIKAGLEQLFTNFLVVTSQNDGDENTSVLEEYEENELDDSINYYAQFVGYIHKLVLINVDKTDARKMLDSFCNRMEKINRQDKLLCVRDQHTNEYLNENVERYDNILKMLNSNYKKLNVQQSLVRWCHYAKVNTNFKNKEDNERVNNSLAGYIFEKALEACENTPEKLKARYQNDRFGNEHNEL